MRKGFEGIWIPASVWEDDRLSATEKILLAEINSFTRRGAAFYKTNGTIAVELKVSMSTVKRAIAVLTDCGYLERAGFDGRKRTLTVKVDLAARPKRASSKTKVNQQPAQKEPAGSPKRAHSKTDRKTDSKTLTTTIGRWPWPNHAGPWLAWIEYKRDEHRFRYKSEHSAQAAIDQLLTLSDHDPERATAIIKQSIANGWKGFFPLDRKQKTATTSQDRDKFEKFIRTGTM